MKYAIKTFGCQMNFSDSERLASFLEKRGWKPTQEIAEADLAIFNTCGVRQMAEDRVYGQIHNARKSALGELAYSRKKIILTGCLAERADVRRRLKEKVDLFMPIHDFPKILGAFLTEIKKTKIKAKDKKLSSYLNISPKYQTKFCAYVPIMTGCNNFCAYCVVPYARGREVSRPAQEIVKEVKGLVKKGYKEIFLLGQNVNSYYGSNKGSSAVASAKADSVTFPKLLKMVNAIPGHFWIRFTSPHPKDASDKFIKMATKLSKVTETIHLPLQAGSEKVLQRMNRHYTPEEYLGKIEKIKNSFEKYKPKKLFSLTTDIIVGFPNETKKDFLESAKIMEKVGFDMAFFGQFSPRPNTLAWKMKDNVSKAEKARREKYLNEILEKSNFKNNQKFVGRTEEVLVEKREKNAQNKDLAYIYFGKNRAMKNVKFLSAKKDLVGKLIKVKITEAHKWNLSGIL